MDIFVDQSILCPHKFGSSYNVRKSHAMLYVLNLLSNFSKGLLRETQLLRPAVHSDFFPKNGLNSDFPIFLC